MCHHAMSQAAWPVGAIPSKPLTPAICAPAVSSRQEGLHPGLWVRGGAEGGGCLRPLGGETPYPLGRRGLLGAEGHVRGTQGSCFPLRSQCPRLSCLLVATEALSGHRCLLALCPLATPASKACHISFRWDPGFGERGVTASVGFDPRPESPKPGPDLAGRLGLAFLLLLRSAPFLSYRGPAGEGPGPGQDCGNGRPQWQ